MSTYFTSSSFLVMTDPTDEKAADAFCPAWDKVSDVFLYLHWIVKEQRKVQLTFPNSSYLKHDHHLLESSPKLNKFCFWNIRTPPNHQVGMITSPDPYPSFGRCLGQRLRTATRTDAVEPGAKEIRVGRGKNSHGEKRKMSQRLKEIIPLILFHRSQTKQKWNQIPHMPFVTLSPKKGPETK